MKHKAIINSSMNLFVVVLSVLLLAFAQAKVRGKSQSIL